jgi:hypothetical protein
MKTDRRTPPRGTPDDSGAGTRRRSLRPLLGALLLLLLGWSSAAPAGATITVSAALGTSPFIIDGMTNSSVTDTIEVDSDGELDITSGLTLSGSGQLTGTLEDGTPMNTPTLGLSASELHTTCPAAYEVSPLFTQSGSGKAYKLGSTVPIKLQILDANGSNVSSSALVVRALGLTQTAGGSDDATILSPGNSNPDSDFRYDATLQGYVFNLSTKNLRAGTWKLMFSVNGQADPSYAVLFDIK